MFYKDIGWSSAIFGRNSEIAAHLPITLENLQRTSGNFQKISKIFRSREEFKSSSEIIIIVGSLHVNFALFGSPWAISVLTNQNSVIFPSMLLRPVKVSIKVHPGYSIDHVSMPLCAFDLVFNRNQVQN